MLNEGKVSAASTLFENVSCVDNLPRLWKCPSASLKYIVPCHIPYGRAPRRP